MVYLCTWQNGLHVLSISIVCSLSSSSSSSNTYFLVEFFKRYSLFFWVWFLATRATSSNEFHHSILFSIIASHPVRLNDDLRASTLPVSVGLFFFKEEENYAKKLIWPELNSQFAGSWQYDGIEWSEKKNYDWIFVRPYSVPLSKGLGQAAAVKRQNRSTNVKGTCNTRRHHQRLSCDLI